jgi:hypothetical protein
MSLPESLQGKSWATVSSDQGGYRVRILTDEEKAEAEQTAEDYHELLGKGLDSQELREAYRSMPSDVRTGRFYKIRTLGQGAVELKGNELHAILPMTSIDRFDGKSWGRGTLRS